jgi:hypothetical protein
MQKYEKEKNMDTWRSKKKIGTHEGPKVLNKKKDEHIKAHEKKKKK